ncbi:MAG: alpha-L-fucosidase [Muribaculaceae bacterium]|nr:alpha-L-fucosidase [Muribaculaceae bacterium]
MKKFILYIAFSWWFSLFALASNPKPCPPLPSQQQLDWQKMETYAFIHYSINTYTGEEWGFGNEDVELFNPDKLDVLQWVKVIKDAGLTGIILTAKHHSGFCLWPSQFTEYSVKNSPWKDGKGDLVKELKDACDKFGLKFAVYLSPWDRNFPEYGKPEYIDYFRNQLTELLTNYGDIFEVWFDGANGGTGWYGGANENRKIDKFTYYDWENTYDLIRELQPDIMIWNDGNSRGDLRWVGTEDGYVGQPNWSLLSSEGLVTREQLHHGVENGDRWVAAEVNTSIRPGWFYHEREDNQVKSLANLMDSYYKSVGRNATLLLNFPIRPDGLIDKNDSITALAFGNYIKELFKTNLADGASIDNSNNVWTVKLEQPSEFNRILIQEPIELGQRIKSFKLEALIDGNWIELKDELLPETESLSTIGYKRIVCFPTITTDQVKLTVLDSKCEPLISNIGIFNAPPIVEPLVRKAAGDEFVETNLWSVIAPGVSELEWRRAIDRHNNSVYNLPDDEGLLIDMKKETEFEGFSFLPDRKTKNGLVLAYQLSISSDGINWEKIAEGEFSNIENNPIRQTVKTPKSKARYLKFTPTRLCEGNKASIADFKIFRPTEK